MYKLIKMKISLIVFVVQMIVLGVSLVMFLTMFSSNKDNYQYQEKLRKIQDSAEKYKADKELYDKVMSVSTLYEEGYLDDIKSDQEVKELIDSDPYIYFQENISCVAIEKNETCDSIIVNGRQGKSAYDIWLDNGNEGTEEYFLTTLVGKQGEKGEQGFVGATGQDGTDGADGKDGADGADGADGQDGADGPRGEQGPQADSVVTISTNSNFGPIVGFTASTYSGNIAYGSLIGYAAAHAICDAEFSGSHFCLKSEILKSIANDNYSFNGTAWFSNGPPGYLANANDCLGWTSDSGTYLGPFWNWGTNSQAGAGWLTNCAQFKSLMCCEGN